LLVCLFESFTLPRLVNNPPLNKTLNIKALSSAIMTPMAAAGVRNKQSSQHKQLAIKKRLQVACVGCFACPPVLFLLAQKKITLIVMFQQLFLHFF